MSLEMKLYRRLTSFDFKRHPHLLFACHSFLLCFALYSSCPIFSYALYYYFNIAYKIVASVNRCMRYANVLRSLRLRSFPSLSYVIFCRFIFSFITNVVRIPLKMPSPICLRNYAKCKFKFGFEYACYIRWDIIFEC